MTPYPGAVALGGYKGVEIGKPFVDMLSMALAPDQRSKLTIKEDGSINFNIASGTKEAEATGKLAGTEGARALVPKAGGPTAKQMYGLTPEQMQMAMQYGLAGERGRMQTFAQILALPEMKANIELTKAKTALAVSQAMPGRFEVFRDERGRIFQRNLRPGPDYGKVTKVADVPGRTLEEAAWLKTIPTDIARGSYWRDPDKPELGIKFVATGETPPKGFTEMVPRVERHYTDLAERRFAAGLTEDVANMADKILRDVHDPGNPALIAYVNEHSMSDFGFFWEPKKHFLDQGDAIMVKLPTGKTMQDVRNFAAVRPETTVEDVLRSIHERQKKKKKK